jgi:hypothetical protein
MKPRMKMGGGGGGYEKIRVAAGDYHGRKEERNRERQT